MTQPQKQLRTHSIPSGRRSEWHTKEERLEDLDRTYNKIHNEITHHQETDISDTELLNIIILLMNSYELRDPNGMADLLEYRGAKTLPDIKATLHAQIDAIIKDLTSPEQS